MRTGHEREEDKRGKHRPRWDRRVIRSLGDEESVDPKERVAAECQEETAMCEWPLQKSHQNCGEAHAGRTHRHRVGVQGLTKKKCQDGAKQKTKRAMRQRCNSLRMPLPSWFYPIQSAKKLQPCHARKASELVLVFIAAHGTATTRVCRSSRLTTLTCHIVRAP